MTGTSGACFQLRGWNWSTTPLIIPHRRTDRLDFRVNRTLDGRPAASGTNLHLPHSGDRPTPTADRDPSHRAQELNLKAASARAWTMKPRNRLLRAICVVVWAALWAASGEAAGVQVGVLRDDDEAANSPPQAVEREAVAKNEGRGARAWLAAATWLVPRPFLQ